MCVLSWFCALTRRRIAFVRAIFRKRLNVRMYLCPVNSERSLPGPGAQHVAPRMPFALNEFDPHGLVGSDEQPPMMRKEA